MSLLILVGLALVLLALLLQAAVPRMPRGVASAAGSLLSLLALLGGSRTAALPLPFGFAGTGGGLQLDGLSCPFLLLCFTTGCFAELAMPRQRELPACLAAVALTLLAGDVFLLAIGGTWALLAIGHGGVAGPRRAPLPACCCLVGACALLAGLATPAGALLPDGGFALVRGSLGAARAGLAAALLPALTIGAVMPLLGLAPCGRWHRRLCTSQPGWVPALASLLGMFLLLRLLADLATQSPGIGWDLALMVLGLGSALAAGTRALQAPRLRAALGSLLALQNGLVVVPIGICLLARDRELPALAATALQAATLLLPAQLLAGLAALALAEAVETEAGAGLLSRLGGLVQSMPDAAWLGGGAAAMLGFLPPLAGFAGLWLLLQSMLALTRAGVAALPALTVLLVAALVVVAGLSALGWLRLCAIVFLGRPRTPRGAAAQDITAGLKRGCAVLLGATLLIGLLPGLWLRSVAPLRALLSAAGDADPPLLRLLSPGGGAVLAPLPLALLLMLALAGGVWALRRLRARPLRQPAAWEGGMPPPPPWLPFGDPVAQIGPATPGRALQAALGLQQETVSGRLRPVGLDRRRRLRLALQAASAGTAGVLRRQGGLLALLLLAAMLGLGAWSWPA